MAKRLRIVPLEERIVLDAAAMAVVANAVVDAQHQAAEPMHANVVNSNSATPMTGPVTIIYVDANAGGSVHDGTSWSKAYTNLQDALNKAASTTGADQIWIAKGTYTPSQVYSPEGVTGGASGLNVSNLKTFNLPDNVALYGGFKSGMTSLSQRDPDKYVTTLSGDLLGNDINDPNNAGYAASKADNSWHVVFAGDDVAVGGMGVKATLDGLSIIDGYANGPQGPQYNHNFGGGMYTDFNSTININDVTFKYNFAGSDGGGMYTNNSNVVISHSTFMYNSALIRAGALDSFNTNEGATAHTTLVTNSYFQDNTSAVFGGAIVGEGGFPNDNSMMIVKDSTFVHNIAAEGGAITWDSLNTKIINSDFYNNIAHVNGGAVANTNVVNTFSGGPFAFVGTIDNSRFVNNVAEGDLAAWDALNHFIPFPPGFDLLFARGGGAITTYMHGHTVINDSLFVNNRALSGDGGAIINGDSSLIIGGSLVAAGVSTDIHDSVFINNRALNGNGGAIASQSIVGFYPASSTEAHIMNVWDSVFIANYASQKGGAIYLDDSISTVKCNLFAFNNAVGQGDDFYAQGSIVNNLASSAPNAESNLALKNIFFLLDHDDIYMI